MAATLKIRKIGDSLGVILPKEVTDGLHVAEDDTLHCVVDKGTLRLTPCDPGFDAAMKPFAKTRRKYRNALRALAK